MHTDLINLLSITSRHDDPNKCLSFRYSSFNHYWLAIIMLTFIFLTGLPGQNKSVNAIGTEALTLATELSSPIYTGRQMGTPGSVKAAEVLIKYLNDAGLLTTTQEFQELLPFCKGQAMLEVIYPNGSKKEFKFREDFREEIKGGFIGGSAEGSLYPISATSDNFPNGAILLIPSKVYKIEDDLLYRSKGAAGIIIEISPATAKIKSTYAGQGYNIRVMPQDGLIKMGASYSVFAELLSASNKKTKVKLANPIEYIDVVGKNIIASYNGDGGDFTPLFVLTAHYDHVGQDANGKYFAGALDNASGTALASSIAKTLVAAKFKGDFAVILSDGEESGLYGAFAFIKDPTFNISGIPMINIDLVGASGDLPITLEYSNDQVVPFVKTVAKFLGNAGISTEQRKSDSGSDFVAYSLIGGLSVSLTEYRYIYHTFADTSKELSSSELTRLGKAIYTWATGIIENKK